LGRKARVRGTPAGDLTFEVAGRPVHLEGTDNRIPFCGTCRSQEHMRRFEGSPVGWVCTNCLPVESTTKRLGIELPTGVKDPNAISFTDVFPNRAARRAARVRRS
jgi:hypothetical protein